MTFRPFGAYLLQKIRVLSMIVSSSVLCCAKRLCGVQQIGSDTSARNGYVMGQALNVRNEICETLGAQLQRGCHQSSLPLWRGGWLLAPTQWNQGPAFQLLLGHLIVADPSIHSCSFSFLYFVFRVIFFFLSGTSTLFLFNSSERPFTKGIWIFLSQKALLEYEW